MAVVLVPQVFKWEFWALLSSATFRFEDILKNKDDFKNKGNLKSQDKFLNEVNLKNKDNLKNEDGHKNEDDIKKYDDLKRKTSSRVACSLQHTFIIKTD